MKNFKIEKLTQTKLDKKQVWEKVREIFFLNALKKFNNDDERLKFSNQWLLPYWEDAPKYFYLLICDNVIAGYLSGHPDTTEFIQRNQANIHVSYLLFRPYHKQYPAHLHINLHPNFTGHGGGELLVQELIQQLRQESSSGLHIVTAPNARNTKFYRKLGFINEITDSTTSVQYHFMGMNLSANTVP